MASESPEALTQCRLAERQGLLTGDLSDLQRLALLAVINDEVSLADKQRSADFKTALIAANLERSKEILETLDRIESEDTDVVAPEDIKQLTVDDKNFMLQEMRRLGIMTPDA